MEIELDDYYPMGNDETSTDVYFNDDAQEIITKVRGAHGSARKEELVKDKREYFKRKLAGK